MKEGKGRRCRKREELAERYVEREREREREDGKTIPERERGRGRGN